MGSDGQVSNAGMRVSITCLGIQETYHVYYQCRLAELEAVKTERATTPQEKLKSLRAPKLESIDFSSQIASNSPASISFSSCSHFQVP